VKKEPEDKKVDRRIIDRGGKVEVEVVQKVSLIEDTKEVDQKEKGGQFAEQKKKNPEVAKAAPRGT